MSTPVVLPPPSLWLVIRSLAYTAWLYLTMLLLGLAALPLLLGPRSGVLWAVHTWIAGALWALRVLIGLRIEVRGLEHRPTGGALVAAKHLSMLDTIAPFQTLPDPCYVLKKELMRLPVYGWYAAATRMIPVNRGGGQQAVKDISAAARARITEHRQIVIFPEGTRKEIGAEPTYKHGVAALYRDLERGCTPMATNSGLFWPAHGFVRRPGVAVFEFLEPIPPGLHRGEFMRRLEKDVEAATNRLIDEGLEYFPGAVVGDRVA